MIDHDVDSKLQQDNDYINNFGKILEDQYELSYSLLDFPIYEGVNDLSSAAAIFTNHAINSSD